MAIRNADIQVEIARAESSIISTLTEQAGVALAPRVVITRAVQQGVSESIVRSAIWFLLDRDVISMTNDRKLVAIAVS